MLQTPDRHTNNILKLADFIEALPPHLYDQRTYGGSLHANGGCLCGWINEHFLNSQHLSDWTAAAEWLGLHPHANHDKVYLLFGAVPNINFISAPPTPAEAASMLRHFAITGEVRWTRVERKEPALVSR